MAKPRAKQPTDDQATGGNTAVLDPPAATDDMPADANTGEPEPMMEEQAPASMFPPVRSDWSAQASQHVTYYHDELGRVRAADVMMRKGDLTYWAAIRWEDGLFSWWEPDLVELTGWRKVKRGQHQTQLGPIVEQAMEYATNRVFGSWVT